MLRVSAVKELPALSRIGDAGALDCEGPSADRRVADASGAGWSRVVVEGRRGVTYGDTFNRTSRWLPGRKRHAREVAACASTAAPAPGRLSDTALLSYPGDCRRDDRLHYIGCLACVSQLRLCPEMAINAGWPAAT